MTKRLLTTEKILNLSADPPTGTAGEMYFNTTIKVYRYYDGTQWTNSSGGINHLSEDINPQLAADLNAEGYNITNADSVETTVLDLTEAKYSADVKNITVTTAVLIDSFNYSSYRSAEYIIQFSQNGSYSMTKLMLIQDGTNASISEYGTVSIGSDIPYDFNTNFSLGSIEILLTCSTADIYPVSVKFSRVLFDS